MLYGNLSVSFAITIWISSTLCRIAYLVTYSKLQKYTYLLENPLKLENSCVHAVIF